MKQAQKSPKWLSITAIFMVMLALVGCGAVQAVNDGAGTVELVASEALAMETEVDEAVVEDGAVGETAVTLSDEPVTDECFVCHINKELLIDTADPIEEVISESEGEG